MDKMQLFLFEAEAIKWNKSNSKKPSRASNEAMYERRKNLKKWHGATPTIANWILQQSAKLERQKWTTSPR